MEGYGAQDRAQGEASTVEASPAAATPVYYFSYLG